MRVRAYRFALDPRPGQVEVLERHAGAARWAYNYALAAKNAAYVRRCLIVDELVTLGWSESAATLEARSMVAVPSAYAIAKRWTTEREQVVDPRQRCTWWRGINRHAFVAGVAGDAGTIREWARANGWEVSDRGRVSAEIREAYVAAH